MRSERMNKSLRHRYARVLSVLALPVLSVTASTQILFEDDFESANNGASSLPATGSYVVYKAETISLSDQSPGATHPAGKVLRLDRSSHLRTGHRRAAGRFERPATAGEQLRLDFDLRLEKGSALQFGLGSSEGGIPMGPDRFHSVIVSLSETGAVSVYDGSKYQPVPGLSFAPGKWHHCALEFQVGSDHIILSIGPKRAVIHGPFARGIAAIGIVEELFVSTAGDEVRGAFDNIRAAIVENPALTALPVFGRIIWTQSEMPFIRKGPKGGISGVGMCAAEGKIYFAGGFFGKDAFGDGTGELNGKTSKWAYAFDPNTGTWQRLPDLPARAEYGRMLASESSLYFLGGAAYPVESGRLGLYTPSDAMSRFDLAKGTEGWQPAPPMLTPRTHFAAGKVGRWFVTAGGNLYDTAENGYSPKTLRPETEVFDLQNPHLGWHLGSPMPAPARGWTASVGAGGKLWVFGGVTFEPSGKKKSLRLRLSETLSYDPATGAWTRHAPAPLEISGWAAVAYGERYIILVGGYGSAPGQRPEMNAQPLVYDMQQDRWMRFARSALPPAGAFNDPGVAISGSTLYVGGGEGYGGSHYNHWLTGQIEEQP